MTSSTYSLSEQSRLRAATGAANLARAAFVLALVACFALGAWLQANVHLNHDVGWITHSAGWLLDGKRFGSDIVDPNPPLIWFLSLPAAMLARAGWLSEPSAIRAYIWVLCAVSIALCYHLLRPLRESGQRLEARVLVLALAAAFTLLPAAAFAQREFLSFVLGLPYCLLVAGRIVRERVYPRSLAIAVGVLAGVAFGFKPWLLAVPAAVEIVYLLHRRRVPACLRPESIALAVTLVTYVLAVVVFARDYLTDAIPLIRSVYWAYDQTDYEQLKNGVRGVLSGVLIAVALLAVARSFSAYARVLCAVLLGFAFSYWIQKKGFAYHAYPVIATSFVLLCYACARAARTFALDRTRRGLVRFLSIAVIALLVCQHGEIRVAAVQRWFDSYRLDGGSQGAARQALIDRINELVPSGGHVYAFSTHPYPAFPTMNYVHAEWASAFPCQFILPAYVKRSSLTDAVQLQRLNDAVMRLRQVIHDDFVRYRPEVVMVNTSFRRLGLGYSKFDDVAFYNEDARFAEIWRQYQQVAGPRELPNIRIFVRRGAR